MVRQRRNKMVRPENPYHKVADYGHGEVQFNEYPEFAAWQEGADARLRAVVEDFRREVKYFHELEQEHIAEWLTSKANEYEAELEEDKPTRAGEEVT